ncbi:hypothetical protein AAG570_009747 [Ranatra chinensis]|uniref:Uncharacterized protein n=1 Tax=Ranatra chinensis TaxID=642074 RepID=A0ABD0Z2Y8_9HEMI
MSEGLQDIQSQKDGKLHVPISVVYENKKQETTEIGTCNLLSKIYFDDRVYDEIKNDYMHSYKRTPVLKTLGLMLLDKTYMGSNVYYEDITYAIEQLDMGVIKAHEQITVSLNKQIEVLKKE